MKANELSIGWALTQRNRDEALRRVIANVKNYGHGMQRLCRNLKRQCASVLPTQALTEKDEDRVATPFAVTTTIALFCLIYLAAVLQ